jgi:signal transduction histidine kinase/CheY-like chemotaxis protein
MRTKKVTVTLLSLVMSAVTLLLLAALTVSGLGPSSSRWLVVAIYSTVCLLFSAAILLTGSRTMADAGGHSLLFGALVVLCNSALTTGVRIVLDDGSFANAGIFVVGPCFSSVAAFVFRSKGMTLLWGALPVTFVIGIFAANGARPGDADFGATVTSITMMLSMSFMNSLFLAYFSSAATTLISRAAEAKLRMKDALRDAGMERSANAAKTRFVAVMSHEIRNPLQAVLLQVEMLEGTRLSMHQLDYVKGIGRASQVLLAIVNDVLDVTKIESGAIALESAEFNVREAAEFTVQTVAPLAAQKGISLFLSMDAGTPSTVKGDVTRLRQILHNLLGNALKFTSEGEVELSVSLDPPNVWRFSVRDTGIGISSEGQRKLFREFSQVDDSTTREFGGTGLGLFIVKQLSELMGGGVSVDAELGVGSTFHSTVRLDPVQADAERAQPVAISTTTCTWRCFMYATNERFVASTADYLRYFFAAASDATVTPLHDASSVAGRMVAELTSLRDETSGRLVLLVDRGATDSAVEAKMIKDLLTLASEHPDTFTPVLVAADPPADTRQRYVDEGWRHLVYKPVMLDQLCTILANTVDVDHPGNVQLTDLVLPGDSPARAPSVSLTASPAKALSGAHTLTRGRKLPAFDAAAADASASTDAPLILVVDDFQLVRDLVRTVISSLGYRTAVASNGQECLDLVTADYSSFAMVLMDCEMPVLDGYGAAEGIRRLEKERGVAEGARLPVCAMTANAMREDVQKCLQRGMDDFLSKPVKRGDLQVKLESWAKRSMPKTKGGSKRRKGPRPADPGDRRSTATPPSVPPAP